VTHSPITRLGLQISGYAFGVRDSQLFERVVDAAQTAEVVGFDSVWTMDHLHQIASVGDRNEPILEAYTALAALAARTSQVRLGVLVSSAGFRNPALLAKMVTTIDIISQGRAILGVGAGWLEEEHESYGLPFPSLPERLARLDETVQICRAMFTSYSPTFAGKYHRVTDALNVPEPVTSGGPPILIGGGGERVVIPMVARLADACNFFGGPATVRHKIDVLERACEQVGRDPATITKTWLGAVIVAESERELQPAVEHEARQLGVSPAAARNFALCGVRDDIAEQVQAYRDAGIDGMIITMRGEYRHRDAGSDE
jgi:F420-dependent oxidoreductase-like protein